MIKIQKSPNSLLRPFLGSPCFIYTYLLPKMTRRASFLRLADAYRVIRTHRRASWKETRPRRQNRQGPEKSPCWQLWLSIARNLTGRLAHSPYWSKLQILKNPMVQVSCSRKFLRLRIEWLKVFSKDVKKCQKMIKFEKSPNWLLTPFLGSPCFTYT